MAAVSVKRSIACFNLFPVNGEVTYLFLVKRDFGNRCERSF